MPTVQVRYPGRACVLGEHCDWAGGASLTTTLPMGIVVKAETGLSKISVHSELQGEVLEDAWFPSNPHIAGGPLRFVPAAIQVLERAGIELKATDLWIESDLPAGRGFSSSAAFSLGVLDALARFSGTVIEPKQLVEMAYEVENGILGIRCGRLDPAACASGQPLFLRWSRDMDGAVQMHAHRISPITTFHFIVGAFERPRNTAQILQTLSQHHDGSVNDPDGDAVREAIAEFGSLAEAGAHAMQTSDVLSLGKAMNQAQSVYETNLAQRFSSTQAPRLIETCHHLRHEGALGAKFSGAGGDGSVVALFETENEARAAALQLEERGLQAWYAPAEPI